MLKRLSELNEERLAYFLARIREIALLGDEAALIETDKLIWEFWEINDHDVLGYDEEDDDEEELSSVTVSSVSSARYERNELKRHFNDIRNLLKRNELTLWTIND